MTKLYAKRDIEAQDKYYTDHLLAMTAEGLHNKSDIAAELAHRDIKINALREAIKKTLDENGHLADGENCTLIELKRAIEEG